MQLSPAIQLSLVSVNIGKPEVIGEREGRPVRSSIRRRPAPGPMIRATADGLEGDRVADGRVHGGVDKAVYAYPSDHWDWWRTDHDMPCMPGSFGENLTLKGADETQVRIGDRFRWGPVLLEVSQPRSPCYKFQMVTGRDDAAALMTISGRCGWYFRVLEEGEAPTSGVLERETAGDGPTVRETFWSAFNRRQPAETREAIAAHPALATAWKRMVQRG